MSMQNDCILLLLLFLLRFFLNRTANERSPKAIAGLRGSYSTQRGVLLAQTLAVWEIVGRLCPCC
jgi:hypothetical protein